VTKEDKRYYENLMRQCINLALIAKERGDSPVGSIVVKDGSAISEGIEGGKTHKDITFHAEIEAIRQARDVLNRSDLSDCILITTHEPCIMCSYVIRHHRIKQIIVGVSSGEVGGYSSALPLLLDRTVTTWVEPPKIISGILEQACKELKN
jgi:tRNA(adenine34) deaminase